MGKGKRRRATKPTVGNKPGGQGLSHGHGVAGERAEMMGVTPHTVGKRVDSIPVELSTRFLEHFSEQLYSSPQKAFEELISNGWDAGATVVDVRIDANLQAEDATLAVFDNGTSMDMDGLRDLWHIAFSPKEGRATEYGRPLIGKFGIGKLATYVLAERLTYICKAEDGVIRRVTMNYGDVDTQGDADTQGNADTEGNADTQEEADTPEEAEPDRLINNLKLDVYELDGNNLASALEAMRHGNEILELIRQQTPEGLVEASTGEGGSALTQREFGGTPAELKRPVNCTWTLVVLSDLKTAGRALKTGILRRILAAALPFGAEMAIHVNGERLVSRP